MNRLVIIGNGFDLAHGLETSYKNFIDWYWRKWVLDLCNNHSRIAEDVLCRWELINTNPIEPITWYLLTFQQGFFRFSDPMIFKEQIENSPDFCIISKSLLLDRITKNIETKGWTDIESDYYELLKTNVRSIKRQEIQSTPSSFPKEYLSYQNRCKKLHEQLDFLRQKLVDYLNTLDAVQHNEKIHNCIYENIQEQDIETSRNFKLPTKFKIGDQNPLENIMLLSFNYTKTADLYVDNSYKSNVNYIHGSLEEPNNIIFGYGDEMDKDFQELIDRNENELLKNSKSIKYLETSHYRKLLEFIEGGQFQVYIMGHSCGNSDRTLLNTIFEHQNCISIKPFCYFNEKGEDNYSELTRNIYRNFTDKKLFRDRVVNKERCTTLDGNPLI